MFTVAPPENNAPPCGSDPSVSVKFLRVTVLLVFNVHELKIELAVDRDTRGGTDDSESLRIVGHHQRIAEIDSAGDDELNRVVVAAAAAHPWTGA